MSNAAGQYDAYLERRHFEGLDGLRCLAILPVIAHHATAAPPHGIWGKGAVGVDLFFVLSGFLITTLLLREQRASGRLDLGRFYLRRTLRIFPLYYAVLGLQLLSALTISRPGPPREHFLANWHWHATYMANWFVDYDVPHSIPFAFSWTLCVEEQFYLFWPGLVALLPKLALPFVLVGGILFDQEWVGRLGLSEASYRIVSSFAPAIAWGALLALGLDSRRVHGWLGRVLRWRFAAPAFLLGVVAALSQTHTNYYWLCSALVGLVGSTAVTGGGVLRPLLEQRWIVGIGQLSYALYLTHSLALAILRTCLPASAQVFPIVFGLGFPMACGLAWLARRYIELPALRWRDRRISSGLSVGADPRQPVADVAS
ncbi:MAG TPA: acyltransferase [Polyangiaceae bacterium]|nr:acyltransferase [Polyangiaceae bacterium]